MVGWNWFLPESPITAAAWAIPGTYPLIGVYQGQPCCSMMVVGQNSWETSLDASGITMMRLGSFPVRVEISGGISVEVSFGLRPSEWRRGVSDHLADGLQSDSAVFARVFRGQEQIAEAWSEWSGVWGDRDGRPDAWHGLNWQLGIGWTSDETVYAHVLPFSGTGFIATNIGFASDFSMDFGTGMSFGISLPGVYQGPRRIKIQAYGETYLPNYYMPCEHFFGHVVPLSHKLPFTPDGEEIAARLEKTPWARFGCLSHVSRAIVARRTFALTYVEADFDVLFANGGQWPGQGYRFGSGVFGDAHNASLRQYEYYDHAVIPSASNTPSNLSPVAAENDRLGRLRIKWTIDKKIFQQFNRPDFPGQFVFESDIGGHGAWGEWSTKGWVATDQKAVVPVGSGSLQDFFLHITEFSIQLSLTRHTLADASDAQSAEELQRKYSVQLRAWLSVRGRYGTEQGGAVVSDIAYSRRAGFQPIHLRQSDTDALFGGQKAVLTTPYSPDGLGYLYYANEGTLEITGIGLP